MHYHNRAGGCLKEQAGITFCDHEGKRDRERRRRRLRRRDSFVSAKANFKKGTGRRSSFSAFLPFIEIAETSFHHHHRRSVSFRSLGGRDTENQREEAAFVYLTQFGRDAFSSSCAMNQDFLQYFPEYQIPPPLSYTGWPELPRAWDISFNGILFVPPLCSRECWPPVR